MALQLDGGLEFLVNYEATNTQYLPHLTSLPGGGFAAVWTSTNSPDDADAAATKLRVFDANGNPVIAESQVNVETLNSQTGGGIAAFADGRYVVTWETDDTTADGDGSAIKARLYKADGTPVDDGFVVNDQTTGQQRDPHLTTLSDGKFVVTWNTSDTTQDTSGSGIKARVFNGDGTPVDDEFLVNVAFADEQGVAKIAAGSDGGFLITWRTDDTGQDGSGSAIKGRLFNADGTAASGELLVNSEFAGNQQEAVATALPGGRYVVTWTTEDATQDGDDKAIKARILNDDGTFAGDEFLVNSEGVAFQDRSSVAALSDGRFIVAWTTGDPLQDGDPSAIKARVFNEDGTAASDEFLVNAETVSAQVMPRITELADGRILVGWQTFDATQDGDGGALKGRIFDLFNQETGTGDADVLIGESIRDVFKGKGGKDLLLGKEGDDLLDGGSSKDSIHGGAGDDELLGGSGKDGLRGGSGDDDLQGESGDDDLKGGRGDDHLDGGDDDDILRGGDDDDTLVGGDGKDILKGEDDDDTLDGGKGKDILKGGDGDDDLTGGGGKDTFVFKPDEDTDVITDFQNGKDKLDLSAFGFAGKDEALEEFSEVGTDSDDRIVFDHDGTAIEINGIDMGQLGGGDLII